MPAFVSPKTHQNLSFVNDRKVIILIARYNDLGSLSMTALCFIVIVCAIFDPDGLFSVLLSARYIATES
jgi:hypothetical protein